ncbi:MAG: transglutaminase family protein [Leptolyngbyaceae bacterium]|nr:transglutaminase family protein [Leptolyngbyaceae bacterium]
MSHPTPSSHEADPQRRTVRPIGAYALHGIAAFNDALMALDSIRGYLLKVNCQTDDTTLLNPLHVEEYLDCNGLAIDGNTIWFTRGHDVCWSTLSDPTPRQFVTLPYPVNGVAVHGSTVYVTCQKSGYIHIFERQSRQKITKFPQPGVGIENLCIRDDELWVSDRTEQTVYCLDRATGEIRFSLLTPYSTPTGIAFLPSPHTGQDILYVAYAFEEPYIRDDPNAEDPYQLTFRQKTFIHPLHIYINEKESYTLSNGYLIEMSYVEEMLPLDAIALKNLEWRIALPSETIRQKVLSVEPFGLPFTEEEQNGQRIAVFRFDSLEPNQGAIFGWKALIEVRSIKYHLTPDDVANIPALPIDFAAQYLVDDDDLSMDTPTIRQAAQEAKGTETNLLRKMLRIRNYVYDRLSYGIRPHIDTPDIALERGIGSCGEYVGVLLALARLNNIPCRTIGRYKCPQQQDLRHIPLEPDFNHVWLEFYVPGRGWLPMESNVDDVVERGPYPTRFFMGLAWYHIEIGKGVSFEKIQAPDKPEDLSIGDLALNHIRFRILEELPPISAEHPSLANSVYA